MADFDGEDTLPGRRGPVAVTGWAGATDVGLTRSRNEDKWGHIGTRCFVVADGVGGAIAGELAAETAVGVMVHAETPLTEATAPELVAEANAAVLRAGQLGDCVGLASTLVAMGVHADSVVITHVGDSRAYRLRHGIVDALTTDHSVLNRLLAAGLAPDEIGASSPLRLDALTTYLGMDSDCVPDVATVPVLAGDRLLLCSDGVYGQLTEDELLEALEIVDAPESVATMLEWANRAGGRDNATAVVVDFGDAVGA